MLVTLYGAAEARTHLQEVDSDDPYLCEKLHPQFLGMLGEFKEKRQTIGVAAVLAACVVSYLRPLPPLLTVPTFKKVPAYVEALVVEEEGRQRILEHLREVDLPV